MVKSAQSTKQKLKLQILDAMNGDYRTVVLPTIDVIASDTYAFRRQFHPSDFASRGVFDWAFKYQLVPLLPSTILQPTKPFETPIMAGGLFVISAQFFWELGAYDEGLNTYGTLEHSIASLIFKSLFGYSFFSSSFLNRW